jgi:acetyl-CoA acetyltransferase
MTPNKRLNHRFVLKVAVFADVDPRCVENYWMGTAQTRPANMKAIRAALAQLGIPDPHPEMGAVSL